MAVTWYGEIAKGNAVLHGGLGIRTGIAGKACPPAFPGFLGFPSAADQGGLCWVGDGSDPQGFGRDFDLADREKRSKPRAKQVGWEIRVQNSSPLG